MKPEIEAVLDLIAFSPEQMFWEERCILETEIKRLEKVLNMVQSMEPGWALRREDRPNSDQGKWQCGQELGCEAGVWSSKFFDTPIEALEYAFKTGGKD